MSGQMVRITISIPGDLKEEVDDHLDYGDSRSEWIKVAIEQRLEAEGGDSENRNPAEPSVAA